jgi:hypothetical protein
MRDLERRLNCNYLSPDSRAERSDLLVRDMREGKQRG